MKLRTASARLGVATVLAPVVLVMASGPALAADNVNITNTETVQAHLNADGSLVDARVYEQIALQGNGTVIVKNPVSTDNLRNLDGFSHFEVKDGSTVSRQTVKGEQRLRTVSDFDKKLPLKVTATYKLDGKSVKPGDVVGRSGRLQVHYSVRNVTGKNQQVSYDDGTGAMDTETQNVVIPMVGTLNTVLPSSFVDVASGEANMAGDGQGQTKMSFTMTLFGPIGSATSEFGYSANITGGVIPSATISALAVSPLESPSFKGGAGSYKGGADSGIELTAGAKEIDANVLKLRDGAQTLLAGLIQLSDGATKLNTGLAGGAAPGAAKLSVGAAAASMGAGVLVKGLKKARDGSTKISGGLGTASSGSSDLAAGLFQLKAGTSALSQGFNSTSKAPDLVSGSAQIQTALQQLSTGLNTLADSKTGVPAALAGEQAIALALDHPATKTDPGGLLQGIQTIGGGLTAVSGGLGDLASPTKGLPAAKGGVDQVKARLDAALVPSTGRIDQLRAKVAQIQGDLDKALARGGDIDALKVKASDAQATAGCAADPDCKETVASVLSGMDGIADLSQETSAASGELSAALSEDLDPLKASLSAADDVLAQVSVGLGDAVSGVSDLQAGVGQLADGNTTMRKGVQAQLIPGVNKLVEGLTSAVDGALKLNTGAGLAVDGATTLSGKIVEAGAGAAKLDAGAATATSGADLLHVGLGQLGAGSTSLTGGLAKAVDGSALLADGNGQLAAGASKLSSGLNDAASGSGQLAYGLMTAAERGKALPAGAAKLSADGTSKLVEVGETTACDYGLKYAVIVAGAKRATTEAMAYGAPANSTGTTAYALEIAGANGDGDTSMGRGVGALALFGSGAGLVFLRRRLT